MKNVALDAHLIWLALNCVHLLYRRLHLLVTGYRMRKSYAVLHWMSFLLAEAERTWRVQHLYPDMYASECMFRSHQVTNLSSRSCGRLPLCLSLKFYQWSMGMSSKQHDSMNKMWQWIYFGCGLALFFFLFLWNLEGRNDWWRCSYYAPEIMVMGMRLIRQH